MAHKARRDDKTRKRETVAHALEKRSSGAESWGRNERAAVVVYHDSDKQVHCGHEALAGEHGFIVVFWIAHFRDDGEETGGSGVGEDECVDGAECFDEGGVADEFVVGFVDAGLGCCCGSFL